MIKNTFSEQEIRRALENFIKESGIIPPENSFILENWRGKHYNKVLPNIMTYCFAVRDTIEAEKAEKLKNKK